MCDGTELVGDGWRLALFKHSGLQPRFHTDYMTFYGSEGGIHIDGHYGHGPLHLFKDRATGWQTVSVPEHIMRDQPKLDDPTQRNWNILMRHFVADIRGESYDPYQTFEDGAFYQRIIDAVHTSDGWHRMDGLPDMNNFRT